MNAELHLRIVGVLLFALIAVNFVVPRRFDWAGQLRRVELFTRQVFWVHMLFILVVLALTGTLCLAFPHLLLDGTPLATLILCGLAMFWGLRLLVQLFVYDPKIWRGNRFNTSAHVVFTGLWSYFVAVFVYALATR